MDARHAMRLFFLCMTGSLTFWIGFGTFMAGLSSRRDARDTYIGGIVIFTTLLWLFVLALAAEVEWL